MSGLMPIDIVKRAEAKMWEEFGMDPDNPKSWKDAEVEGWRANPIP